MREQSTWTLQTDYKNHYHETLCAINSFRVEYIDLIFVLNVRTTVWAIIRLRSKTDLGSKQVLYKTCIKLNLFYFNSSVFGFYLSEIVVTRLNDYSFLPILSFILWTISSWKQIFIKKRNKFQKILKNFRQS